MDAPWNHRRHEIAPASVAWLVLRSPRARGADHLDADTSHVDVVVSVRSLLAAGAHCGCLAGSEHRTVRARAPRPEPPAAPGGWLRHRELRLARVREPSRPVALARGVRR